MKLNHIEIGQQYIAKIPYRVDPFVNEHLVDVVVTAEETGLHYDVDHRHTTRIRGAAITRTRRSDRADGVRVSWKPQRSASKFGRPGGEFTNEGSGIIPARNIERIAPEWRLEEE